MIILFILKFKCILYITDLSCHYVGETPVKFSKELKTPNMREGSKRESENKRVANEERAKGTLHIPPLL